MHLQCEQNTPAVQREIETGFVQFLRLKNTTGYQFDFEHGQWWVTKLSTGRQWSVNDGEGPGTYNGFDFEIVSEGDEG